MCLMRIRKFWFLANMTILVTALASGCGGNKQDRTSPILAAGTINPSGKPVDTGTMGSVSGTVRLLGDPPGRRQINMAAVPNCSKQHSSPALTEEVVPGNGGTLQNVIVYLKGDLGSYAFKVPESALTLDQNGCVYKPHVIALMVGQPLEVTNSDQATHNIHSLAKANRPRNDSQSPGSLPINQSFSRQEIAIQVKCNVHPWMKAYVAVLSNPYFQVTGEDGSFDIKNVPPGEYKLLAWHELYGTTEETITVAPNESKTLTIAFKTNQASD
jgi:plastocyanin